MDKCGSLFQCSERLLAGWGTRESDLLDCDRSSGSVRYRLLEKALRKGPWRRVASIILQLYW
jgi:hypothetical protein